MLELAGKALDMGVGVMIRPPTAKDSPYDFIFYIDSKKGRFMCR
jgi:hypothetical protein